MLCRCNILFLPFLHHSDWMNIHHINLYFIIVVWYWKSKTVKPVLEGLLVRTCSSCISTSCYSDNPGNFLLYYINYQHFCSSWFLSCCLFPWNRWSFVTSTVETKWMKGFVQMRLSKVRILTCWSKFVHGKCLQCSLVCYAEVFVEAKSFTYLYTDEETDSVVLME